MQIIAGEYKHRRIMLPPVNTVLAPPMIVREALFSMLVEVVPECRFLDLTAGAGAIGLEALSRGAARVTFVEGEPRSLKTLRDNIAALRCQEACQVLPMQAHDFVQRPPRETYDVVFVNPTTQDERMVKLTATLGEWPGMAPGACLAAQYLRRTDPPDLGANWNLLADRRYGKQRLALWQRADMEPTPPPED